MESYLDVKNGELVKKDIMQDKAENQYDEDGLRHGYWFVGLNSNHWYKCYYVNGDEYGYEEWGTGEKKYYAR